MHRSLYVRHTVKYSENQLKWATEQNFMIVQWSVDTVDWKGVSADTITNNVLGIHFLKCHPPTFNTRWAFISDL